MKVGVWSRERLVPKDRRDGVRKRNRKRALSKTERVIPPNHPQLVSQKPHSSLPQGTGWSLRRGAQAVAGEKRGRESEPYPSSLSSLSFIKKVKTKSLFIFPPVP